MKRWKIVLPTLLATSGLPLVSLVGCGNDEPKADITIDLSNDISDDTPGGESNAFLVDTNKTYKFNFDASICTTATEWESDIGMFYVYKSSETTSDIEANIIDFRVRGKKFEEVVQGEAIPAGKFAWTGDMWVYHDFQKVDSKFTMSIVLQFTECDTEMAVARWGSGT